MRQQLENKQVKLNDLGAREQFYEGIVLAQQNEIKAKADAKRIKAEFVAAELKCLADNVYNEAAYESADGQLAVATVIMNRVTSPAYPKSVCGVTYERHLSKTNKIVCQFSWTCKPRQQANTSVYNSIMTMVKGVYFKNLRNDQVANATMYHADYINNPDWATEDSKLAQIGHHIFYRAN